MLSIASDIRNLVHDIGSMEFIGVKVASAETSAIAQNTVKEASSGLYTVMTKSASENVLGDMPHHQRVVLFMDKVASVLRLPEIPAPVRLKMASVVAADDAITDVMSNTPDVVERAKLAEARSFGREFMVELLKGVL